MVRYIHLNPVRAKVVVSPEEYKWSSHNEYLRMTNGIIDTSKVLRLFSEKISAAQNLYRDFVNKNIAGESNRSLYETVEQQILGNETFVEETADRIGKLEMPVITVIKPSLERIMTAVEEVTGIGRVEITSRCRQEDAVFARGLLVAVWREVGYKATDLKPELKRDLSVLSRLSKISETPKGRSAIKDVMDRLNARMQA